MSFLKRINYKNLALHIVLYVVAIVLFVFMLNQFLLWYTHHGESLTVPNLVGSSLNEAEQQILSKDLRYEIKDSVYSPGKPAMSVVDQNPKSGSKVKRGRRIYLIVNTDKAPVVSLPALDQVPLRQAERILESLGLKIDSTFYVPDIALNAVQKVYYQGKEVKTGFKISKGSGVALALGDGGQNEPALLPDLKGHTLDEAIFLLRANYLNLGATVYDSDVVDSSKAIIYKQRPLANGENTTSKGSAVDVWLKNKE